MTLSTATLLGFGLLFFRCAALFMVAPIFAARPVPARIRLVLALLVSVAATSSSQHAPADLAHLDAVASGGAALLRALVAETALGLLAGASARAFLEAAHAAGQTLGLSAGLGFGATLDPTNGAPSTAVGDIVNLLAIGTALALGLHREVIAWLCASAAAFPAGSVVDIYVFVEAAIRGSIEAIALSIRIFIPVAAAVIAAHVVVGVIGRAVPQLSLGNVGFAILLLAGGWALTHGADDMAAIAARAAVNALRDMG